MSQQRLTRVTCLSLIAFTYATAACSAQTGDDLSGRMVSRTVRLSDSVVKSFSPDAKFELALQTALSTTASEQEKLEAVQEAIALADSRLSENHAFLALSIDAIICSDRFQSQNSLTRAEALLPRIEDECLLAWYHLGRGYFFCRQHDYEQAATAFELARHTLEQPLGLQDQQWHFTSPDPNHVRRLLGFCYTRLNDHAKAIESYGNPREHVDSAERVALINAAEQYLAAGSFDQAKRSIWAVDGSDEGVSDIRSAVMARILLEAGETQQSQEIARSALRSLNSAGLHAGWQDDLWATIIRIQLDTGNLDEALRLADLPNYYLLRDPLENASKEITSSLSRQPSSPSMLTPAPSSGIPFAGAIVAQEAGDHGRADLTITQGETAYLAGRKQEGIALFRSVAADQGAAIATREEAYLTLARLARDDGNYKLADESQQAAWEIRDRYSSAKDRVASQISEQAIRQMRQIAKFKVERGKVDFERVSAEQNESFARQENEHIQKLHRRSMAAAVVFGIALCVLLLVDRNRRIQTRLREKEQASNERLAEILAEKSQALRHELEDRVELEKSLERKRRDESIGQLTGNVAHDFNNLLQVILTTNEFLEKQARLNGDQERMLEISNKSAHIGASIVKQLLAYARQQTLAPSVVGLTDYLDGTSTLLRAAVDQSCSLCISDESRGAAVELDPTQLTTALMNLLKNSVDAMPQGGDIQLRIYRQQIEHPTQAGWKDITPGEYVTFEVQDSGKGMSDDELALAFEPFYTTKPPAAGTGLGLSSVYGFVKQSGGDVAIDKSEGGGTCVRMVFPASQESVVDDSSKSRSFSSLSCRILLVEDNVEVGKSILTKLRSMGMQAELVDTGAAAIEFLMSDEDFDLVLSDVCMPGEHDGISLRAWIKENKPEIAVILMSGYSHIDEAPAGAIILQKPFSEVDLMRAMSVELRHIPEPLSQVAL